MLNVTSLTGGPGGGGEGEQGNVTKNDTKGESNWELGFLLTVSRVTRRSWVSEAQDLLQLVISFFSF